MYKEFYGFHDKPFSPTPDLKYLFLGRCQKEALEFLSSAIEQRTSRHIVLTGGIGSGKTMLLKSLVKNLGSKYTIIQVCYPALTSSALLQMILLNIGIESNQEDSNLLREKLTDHLIKLHRKREMGILLVDEAQKLGEDALEETFRLSELTDGGSNLLKIVFSGLPNVMEKFNSLQQSGLPGRAEIFHLKNLSGEEASEYVRHRLVTAGCSDVTVFSEDIIREISRLSEGAPRIINMICDALLAQGYVTHDKIIRQSILKDVMKKLYYLDNAYFTQAAQDFGTASIRGSGDESPLAKSSQVTVETQIYEEKVETSRDEILPTEYSLPLTILILEKNARMKVHLENEFQRNGCNFLTIQRLEDLLDFLDRAMAGQLPVIVADTGFFFTKTGNEEPQGKTVLNSIQARYAYIPIIMTSTLPLTAIRTKLLKRGIPFLMKKPNLSGIDMSEIRTQFNLFFQTLQNSIANIHHQHSEFYQIILKWNRKITD